MMSIRRHDWVYLRRDAAPRVSAGNAGIDRAVRRWIGEDKPLVATRQASEEGLISLGVIIRQGERLQRIACAVATHEVRSHRGPIGIGEAMQVLDGADAAALARFAAAIGGHALRVGIYGSTAWEYFAGRGYRHAHSDVDVICDVDSSAGLTACLAAFCDATQYFTSRLDGEVRISGGHAVAWRELHQACAGGDGIVLAKDDRDVALLALHRVLAPLQ